MRDLNIQIKITFPAQADQEDVEHLRDRLPDVLQVDLHALSLLCVPAEHRIDFPPSVRVDIRNDLNPVKTAA